MPAYAPRAGVEREWFGVVAVGDSTLNVHDALEEGDGVIVVPDSDNLTMLVLDEHPQLKRVAIPDHPPAVSDRFGGLSLADIRDEAKQRGLSVIGKKDELLAAVRLHDAQAAGDATTADVVMAADEAKED